MQKWDPEREMLELGCPRRIRLLQRSKETAEERLIREDKIRDALLKVRNMPNINRPKKVKKVVLKPDNADLTTQVLPDTAFITHEVTNAEALAIVKADTLALAEKEAVQKQKTDQENAIKIINLQSAKNILDDDERNIEDDKAVLKDAMMGS